MSDFDLVHEAYLAAWSDALETGDTRDLEGYLSPDYHGWFCPEAATDLAYDRQAALDGLRQSVQAHRGSSCRVTGRAVARRGAAEAVAWYEKTIERAGEPVAVAMIVEAWRRCEDGWRLERELTEHGAALTD
jgi:hypothetical protein